MPVNAEDRRVHLGCKIDRSTMSVIDGMFPTHGNYGRKVDLLAKEYLKLKSSPSERLKIKEVEKALQDPTVMDWNSRSLASYLHCSKSLVNYVRNRMRQATPA